MRCFRCMKEFSNEYEVCPHCGYICTKGIDKEDETQGKGVSALGLLFLPEGTMLLDRYYIGIVLGCGGFGITYKAYDVVLDVVVAVKEYYPRGMVRRLNDGNTVEVCIKEDNDEYRRGLYRFLAEARTLARFSKHDNIVNVYNYYELNQTAYIVMEYLEGMTLKLYLDTNEGRMSVNDSLWVMQSISKALLSLHKQDILHRDISPDNIFLCSNGRVKLLDFGAAKLPGPAYTTAKAVVKVGYASPEQYRMGYKQDAGTDLYALGATFYRALTGVVPEESPKRLKEDHLESPKEYIGRSGESIPDYVNNAIMKLLMLEPEDRFESAEELLNVLEKRKVVPLISVQKMNEIRNKRIKIIAAWMVILPILILIAALLYNMSV